MKKQAQRHKGTELRILKLVKNCASLCLYAFVFILFTPKFLFPAANVYEFYKSWGKYGTGDGEFNEPHGIAIDKSGYIYVADTMNHRIQKFDSNGNFILKWGSYGTENGKFNYPTDVEIDEYGYVYVVDSSNNRIQKFDSNGNFVKYWGTGGTGQGQFDRPHGIAIDKNGYVYVADMNNNRIQKFDRDGNFISMFGTLGSGDGQFSVPLDIVVDKDGYIYVVDTGNKRIQKFDSNGNFVLKWGSYGSGDGQFGTPRCISIDKDGYLYVADDENKKVQKFDTNGNFILKWSFDEAYGITVDKDGYYVYVSGRLTSLVAKFAPPLVISTTSIPSGKAGERYSFYFSSFGGVSPYNYSIISGSLPDGLRLNSSTGEIVGTPTKTGTYTFTIRVTDALGYTDDKSFTMNIYFTTSDIYFPVGMINEYYSFTIPTPKGATPPCSFTLISGSLPKGITMTYDGLVSGTPTEVGAFYFGVKIVDATGVSAESIFKIKIGKPVSVGADEVKIQGGEEGYINPDRGDKARVVMNPSSSGTIKIKVYNMMGRLVNEFTQEVVGNTTNIISWDCKNSKDEYVTSGIYIMVIEGCGINAKKKIAIVR
jgi:DNA-binding beta-propeller fold protein YncE